MKNEMEEEKSETNAAPSALGGLAGYGGSDSEDESEPSEAPDEKDKDEEPLPENLSSTKNEADQEESIKQARRARAKEWAEKRRLAKSSHDDDPSI